MTSIFLVLSVEKCRDYHLIVSEYVPDVQTNFKPLLFHLTMIYQFVSKWMVFLLWVPLFNNYHCFETVFATVSWNLQCFGRQIQGVSNLETKCHSIVHQHYSLYFFGAYQGIPHFRHNPIAVIPVVSILTTSSQSRKHVGEHGAATSRTMEGVGSGERCWRVACPKVALSFWGWKS